MPNFGVAGVTAGSYRRARLSSEQVPRPPRPAAGKDVPAGGHLMTKLTPVLKCCESHDGWGEVAEHLVALVPDPRVGKVVDVMRRARDAVNAFGLPENEHLQTVEIMVRYQLLQISGHLVTDARLDPESHRRDRAIAI
jgi:hypothetical protein